MDAATLAASDPMTETAIDLRRELERLHPDGFGWALACCDWNRGEAEDVLQSAYLEVLEGRARFGGRSTFRTWLFGVIRRIARARRRRRAWRGEAISRWLRLRPEPVRDPDGESEAAGSERSARLGRALRLLPRRQRELLHLVFYEELTIEEAAGLLGVTVGTGRTHYERGKRALRGLLAAQEER